MRRRLQAALLVAALPLSGCATLNQFLALQHVDFDIDGVSAVRLAGVDMTAVRSFTDLSLTDGARLANAVRQGDLPLSMDVDVLAENPVDNAADARLVRFDWTLVLDGRETISGRLDREVVLPRGEPTVVPVPVTLDLVDFFDGNAQEMFELVLSLTGLGGERKELTLIASPAVDTVLGPITYDQPIRIVRGD